MCVGRGYKVGKFNVRIAAVFLFVILLMPENASAVSAYADQTGQACNACHIGGFGPRLTQFGREFKLEGYTLRGGGFTTPLSAAAVASYVHTSKDQPAPPAPHYGTNDNVAFDSAVVYLAGGFGSHIGSFVGVSYEGAERNFGWEMVDVRAIQRTSLGGSSVVLGLSVNNAPTLQDSWNTVRAWGFPFTDSELAPAHGVPPLIAGPLTGNVLGASAYAWWDSHIYAEAGVYQSLSRGFLRTVGVDPAETSLIDGAAPYLRVAYQKDYGDQNFELGAIAFFADLYPGRDKSAGKTDGYSDIALDASYQYLGGGDNTFIVNALYTHEDQKLRASQLLGNSAKTSDTLNDLHLAMAYYWRDTIGLTVAPFNSWGSSDALLYADSRKFSPDSTGAEFQIDYTPWGDGSSPFGRRFNLRLGLQYTLYTRYGGAGRNYDGAGRNASDNNTLRMFTWIMF